MEKEILVALIASSTSLVVAIISIIRAFLTNNFSKKAEERLKKLEDESDEKKAARSFKDKTLEDNIEALEALITEIQSTKDVLEVVIEFDHTGQRDFDFEDKIKNSRKQMFLKYGKELPFLSEVETLAAHKAKKIAFSIELLMYNLLTDNADRPELVERFKESLQKTRSELTEIQKMLKKSRDDKIKARTNVNEKN